MNRQVSIPNPIGWTRRLNLVWALGLLLTLAVGASFAGELAPAGDARLVDGRTPSDAGAAGGSAFVMPPANNYLAIHPSAFIPNNNDLAYLQGGISFYGTQTGQTFLANAPVQLPHGAEIQGFEVLVSDSSAAEDINVALWRTPDSPPAPDTLASMSTSGTPGATTLTSGPLSHDVDNMTGAYTVVVAWEVPATPSNILVRNVRIIYRDNPGQGG